MAEKKGNFLDGLEPLFTKLNGFSFAQKIGIFIGTIVVLSALYAWLLYVPKVKEINRLKNKEKQLVRQVATARGKANRLKKIRAELENRKEEYLLVTNALPDTKEIPGILSSLSASAKESGLNLHKITPGSETPKDFYAEIPISVEITGGYHEIAVFFDKVSRFGRIVDIKSTKMIVDKDKGIKASCNAVTYRFLKEDTSKKKKKKKK